MSNDPLVTFLSAPFEEQARLALTAPYTELLRTYLGEAAYAEYATIAEATRAHTEQQHLSVSAPKNLILAPGIMGSLLASRTLGGVWWVDLARNLDKLDKLGLQPDGQTDIDPTYGIYPFAIDLTYAPFQRAVLERDDFGHETFPFDWRKPLSASTAQMRDLIHRLYATNGKQPVHIVGHSLGGLVTRATLAQYGDELWPELGRIIFLGTPHYGAALAACRLKFPLCDLDPMSVTLALLIRSETIRSLWGAVSLIPAPVGIYPGTRQGQGDPASHPCANFDLYDVAAWKLGLDAEATARLQLIFKHAAQFYRELYDYHMALDQAYRDRIAVIAGVGYKTSFRLNLNDGPFGGQRDNRREPGNPHRESDGTVPLVSAALENIGAMRYVKHIHMTLPNNPEVYADVFRWLRDEPLRLPQTPEEALSQHLGDAAELEAYPNLMASARRRVQTEELSPESVEPPPEVMASLRAQIEAGQLPSNFNLARLF